MKTFDQFQEARLTADQRRALPNKDFALPGKGEGPKGKQAGSYPIPDKKHARSALSLVSQHGTPEEKATVRAKVKKKFPNIQQESTGGGVPLTPQELEIQKKMSRLNVRLARKRSQQMQKAKVDDTETAPEQVKEGDVHSGQGEKIQKRTKKWMDKKGMKGAPGLDAMKARTAEHKAKRGVKEEVIDERTLSSYIPSDRQGDARRANLDYTKAQLKKKEDQSTKNRGDLSKRDAGKMAKERLHTKKIMSMGEVKEDKALEFVRQQILKKHGKGAIYDPKNPPKVNKKTQVKQKRKRAAADEKERRFKKRNPAVTSGRYPKDDEKAWDAARKREKKEGIS